jgi:hypothetical protein
VGDAQKEDRLGVILDSAYHAVASNSVSPEAYLVAGQGLSLLAGIALSRDMPLKKRDDPLLRVAVQLLEFAESARFEVNGPSQAV